MKHGSPYDRGRADSWYRRPYDPHYWPDGTHVGKRIGPANGMTEEQVEAYAKGFEEQEATGDHKDWG